MRRALADGHFVENNIATVQLLVDARDSWDRAARARAPRSARRGASRADHKKDDGYVPPSDRARARQAPAPSAVLTDPDVAAFDPTADKHDYLLVFATERSRSRETLKWNEVRETWFQAIPGDEEKKTAGVELLRRDWVQRFGEEEECPKGDVLGLCREHVVDLLARRSGLQLKLSLPRAGARRVYCQLRAPVSLLERKADALAYKFKFKDEIDPGPAFWRRSGRLPPSCTRLRFRKISPSAYGPTPWERAASAGTGRGAPEEKREKREKAGTGDFDSGPSVLVFGVRVVATPRQF